MSRMGKSKRAKAAAKAAKRIPLVGTIVAVAPLIKAASDAGLNMSTIGNLAVWKHFVLDVGINYAGYNADSAVFEGQRLIQSYGPIVGYLLARRFFGKHISRVLRPLGLRF